MEKKSSPWLCDYPRSFCKRCGEVIVWMVTEKGRSIPLDPGPGDFSGAGESVSCNVRK